MKKRPGFPANLDLGNEVPPPKTTMAVTKLLAPQKKAAAKPAPPVVSPTAMPTRRSKQVSAPVQLGMDSAAVRERMVRKLAEQGVEDALVLLAMGTVERHRFVDSALVNQAYEDTSLPIGLGQTISKPNVVARMLELLRQGRNLMILSLIHISEPTRH